MPRYRHLWRAPRWALALALATFAGGAKTAAADRVDKLGAQLNRNLREVDNIGQGIRPPSGVGRSRSSAEVNRRLVNARVQFGMGNYDDASVILYDIVESHPGHVGFDEALYYLGEALFRKKDNLAAREYFKRIANERGNRSKFFQQALERLIELSMRLQDPDGVEGWLSALERLPQGSRRPSVPYVRGKYAHFRDQYDKAVQYFAQVPAGSKYDFQARYFIGGSLIAKGDLRGAAKKFQEIIALKPKSAKDRRVIELAHMAIGRLHYERDVPSKAIDSYLNINRKSDLFDDVLYEVAWVYVKNKEYRKALRALELLELTDPRSSRMPEVRILEGNLRIRKAQVQYDKGTGNPVEEYDKALKVFTATKEAFVEPRASLDKALAEQPDASAFINQLTGREARAFETQAKLPEVAASWLREEPLVRREIVVEQDLGAVEKHLEDTEQLIRRIETVIASDARVDTFPELAKRRYKLLDIADATDKSRLALVAELAKRTGKVVNASEQQQLAGYRRNTEQTNAELTALVGDAKGANRKKAATSKFDSVDQLASELQVLIMSTEAEIAALELYLKQSKKPPADAEVIKAKLVEERRRAVAMRKELEILRDDYVVGKGTAGGSADSSHEAKLRARLRENLKAEANILSAAVQRLGGKKRSKAEKILRLLAVADQTDIRLDRVVKRIEAVADEALTEVKQTLAKERSSVDIYRSEATKLEAESKQLGSEILHVAFAEVSRKFRDVLMRSEIGLIDVAWSHKESNERLRRRLVLDRARERRTLDSDFRDVLDELNKLEENLSTTKQGGGQ